MTQASRVNRDYLAWSGMMRNVLELSGVMRGNQAPVILIGGTWRESLGAASYVRVGGGPTRSGVI